MTSDKEEIKSLRGRLHIIENIEAANQLRLDSHDGAIKILETDMKNKVSWKQFTWSLGIIFTFLSTILGIILYQTRSNGESIYKNNEDISINNSGIAELNGIFKGAEVECSN
jgi:hypothetical protein